MSESLAGRPSGTDGSDFSYRMVVDSRYTKVSQGKSRLHALFLFQVVIQLIGVLDIFVLSSEEKDPNALAISSPAVGFLSLMIGDVGRRCSRINFLKVLDCLLQFFFGLLLLLRTTSLYRLSKI
ncbi:uncharacterized protein LOC131146942 isoform X1 [Malania oleifera]|uniref:uncharacterized protein LOC131146942 isoform X1 n=1 Tax=Malania oleifera TaxID=397392 RepID=UPI0025ADBE43|nr:uncharacterized protein LOC131146942 isoform X1 [Malania oleifera]XP_057952786.1 uncharacterized protein LOC131146942 isoform X1 [Malania oleifera]XP_057952787.1 uncharacterized protein LOC131146942 isoform X1 [Malania oleifera]XP_057952788.1 uncharacterized protein LOC131146942 isoform X1 [Malania oleifera]